MPLHSYQRLSEAERLLREAARSSHGGLRARLLSLADQVKKERANVLDEIKDKPFPLPRSPKTGYADSLDREPRADP